MTTREIVRREYDRDPTQTLGSIGTVAGVTRERVRQILNENGLVIDRANRAFICQRCRVPTTPAHASRPSSQWICDKCAAIAAERRRKHPVFCDWCGAINFVSNTEFKLRRGGYPKSDANRVAKGHPIYLGRFFCNRICYGKWFGCFAGFVAHPENALYNKSKTHCTHGHEFTEDNIYHWKGANGRICKACAQRRAREYYVRNKVSA